MPPEPDNDFVIELCAIAQGISEALAEIAQGNGRNRIRFALMVLDDDENSGLPLYVAGSNGAIPEIVDKIRNTPSGARNMIN